MLLRDTILNLISVLWRGGGDRGGGKEEGGRRRGKGEVDDKFIVWVHNQFLAFAVVL